MAHIMLPGQHTKLSALGEMSYAENALEALIDGLIARDVDICRTSCALAGGADVLGDGHTSPGAETIQSVTGILNRRAISIYASHLGGTERRSCTVDIGQGCIYYTIGESGQRVLLTGDWEMAI
jgi:chemotaxis receptor (MCP) glutamine deamidase CheD